MKTNSTNRFLTMGIILVVLIGMINFSFVNKMQDKKKPWNVPDKEKALKNPVKSDAANVENGKGLWAKYCKSCHGAKGLGDGSKAKELETNPGDFSTDLKNFTDGELFYKTKEGRDEMPSFKKKLPDDNDIWTLVNYMRTLSK